MDGAARNGGEAGYVLAGGNSSRMGQNKALLQFRGQPLARRAALAVEQSAGRATLVGNPDTYAGLGFRVIPDLYPGEGPLGGIVTALRDSDRNWNLVAACDMPNLSPEFLRSLLRAAREAGCDALIPECPPGEPQPLCAVYHSRALPHLQAAFDRRVRKVTAALEGLRRASFPTEEVAYFQNLNTPEDWEAYAAK